MELTVEIGICQNCKRPFSIEKARKKTNHDTAFICPSCGHANYDDNVVGYFRIHEVEL